MFDNVLIGLDGGPGGRDAVALATRLTASDGQLTLAHIYPTHAEAPLGGEDYEAAQITRARALLQAASHQGGVDAQLRWIGASSPGRGLHELAGAVHADLLVVGSTRRSAAGRVLLGDDTRAALDRAPCAVAIAPAGYADRAATIRKVGVGYDGSPDSEYALIVAREIVAERSASLAALEVVVFPTYLFSCPMAFDATAMIELLDEARRRVASLGDVEPHAAAGEAAEQLALWSTSLDLLVVGSRGFGPVGRLVHGSTSRELTQIAQCPLLVLTRSPHGKAKSPDRAEPSEPVASVRV